MEISKLLSTNRTLLRITPLSPLRDIKIECFPESKKQTLEQFRSIPGYYLMDTPSEPGWQETIREKELKRISAKIFAQELSELGIPNKKWPNINDFNEFKRCFEVDYLALIADLGTGPIITKEVAL